MYQLLQFTFFILAIITGPMLVFLYVKYKITDRLLCFFLEKDNSTRVELLLLYEEDFVRSQDGAYNLDNMRIRHMRYPLGWPKLLQQPVPCGLFQRGNAVQLDWVTVAPQQVSSKEVGAVLDPHWLKILVRGTQEGFGGKSERILPLMAAAISGVSLIFIFVVMSKLAGLEQTIKLLG